MNVTNSDKLNNKPDDKLTKTEPDLAEIVQAWPLSVRRLWRLSEAPMTSTEGEKPKAVITVRFGCVDGVVAVVRRKKFAGPQI